MSRGEIKGNENDSMCGEVAEAAAVLHGAEAGLSSRCSAVSRFIQSSLII